MDDAGTVSTAKVPIRETWEALEDLVDSGLARSIGISNASAQLLYDMLLYARHPISSLQIEHHPYLVQAELVQMAQENNIAITAYSSFGPQSFLELPEQFRKRAASTGLLFQNAEISSMAARHNKWPAQVLLRWATQRNITVIPKSNSLDRLRKNLGANDFDLSHDELEISSKLDVGMRFNDPGFYLPDFPIRIFA